eukprot:m.50967 g.50967  ORF g.50967 m.50967 type:complete len:743 (+) comp34107_c0_seq2:85-2313(+)
MMSASSESADASSRVSKRARPDADLSAELSTFSIIVEETQEAIGFVRVSPDGNLSHLRSEIGSQLDDPPTDFKFLLKPLESGRICPVSKKQEMTEKTSIYLPSGDVQIRRSTACLSVSALLLNQDNKVNADNESSSEFSMSDYDDHEGLLEEYGIAPKKAPPGFKQSVKSGASQVKKKIDKKATGSSDFKVVEREMWDQKTNKLRGIEKFVVFGEDASDMKNVMRQVTELSMFYERDPKMRVSSLVYYLPKMRVHAKGSAYKEKYLKPLIDFVEVEYKRVIEEIEAMIANKEISFHYLWYLFPIKAKFVGCEGDNQFGSEVHDSKYRSGFFGATFQVGGYIIKANGIRFFTSMKWFTIGEFDGLRSIDDLPIHPLKETSDQFKHLVDRGKVFRKVGVGAHYMNYKANLLWREYTYTNKFKADGRVMVDGASFSRFNPDYRGFTTSTSDDERTLDTLPDDKLFQTWPTVTGFSFAAKKWGELRLPNLEQIAFDETSFARLVLEERKKNLIYSLVTNSSKSFTDIIGGKGGGCIFLLHGPPGVGKTLTAEAIAELLHRPLYSVTIGELGITTTELEGKLRQILEVASIWNAVILIDEADIFLERRSENDLTRNALVGIFLRLLEYHQGVMFLTTNRVRSFDEAFHSRISVALHYEALDYTARKQVWNNLLEAADVSTSSLNLLELAHCDLNGRQIKTTIRLAQTLAYTEGVAVGMKHIEETVMVAKQFEDDLKSIEPVQRTAAS